MSREDHRYPRLDPTRERALVASARVDGAAFAELYDHYLPRIFGFVMRRIGDRTVAEDLTATTFERALAAVRGGNFRNEAFGAWLHRVAANAIVDHARRAGRTVPLGIRAGDRDGDAEGAESIGDERASRAFAAAIDRDELARAIVALPAPHRQVIVLRFVDGLEIEEACAILGCSRGTFAVKLHRALRAMREALERETIDAA